MLRPSGGLQHLAGAHPDLRFSFKFPTVPIDGGLYRVTESLHNLNLELPPGFVADPTAVAACTADEFLTPGTLASCSEDSQVGWVVASGAPTNLDQPIFNLEHGPDVPARFGFVYFGNVPTIIVPSFRAGDYGVSVEAHNLSQADPLHEAEIILWGEPGDPVHHPETGDPFMPSTAPFLRSPTSCRGPLDFTLAADSWEHRDAFDVTDLTAETDGTAFVLEGCEAIPFAPTLGVTASSRAADSPTGLTLEIGLPQNANPAGQATSDLREAAIALPRGMAIAASTAAGLEGCGPAQVGLGSNDAPSCPDASRIGTVKIETPVLDREIEGAVYLATQGDNPFHSDLALYLAAKAPGFYLKLPARVDADPGTGQLTLTLADLPQLPFERLVVELKPGPRAPLTTPPGCGSYPVTTRFVPWSGTTPVLDESSFTVSEGCPGGAFSPGLRAGSADPRAGASTSFALQVTRRDGEENLAGFDLTLPRGLLPRLVGVPLCGEREATSGSCPDASQIGRTVIGAGAGPSPLYIPEPGRPPSPVYLAGPYRGAPYSIVVSLPAQAGPFDLGTVAVRVGIEIDRRTARTSLHSDPLPQVLQGIPIAYRDLRVEIDRPGFIRNPTNCGEQEVEATIRGAAGASASPADGFRASGCGRLGFRPALSLRFSGPTRRSGHPALKAVLRTRKGDANLGRAAVTLPPTEFLDSTHIHAICSRGQYASESCPKDSVYGYAEAWSPLLDQPLRGPVYLRSSGGELPDLVASLGGPIHLDLVARIDSVRARIRAELTAPDAPVSRVVLRMKGGSRGLLVNNSELCRQRPRAAVELTAQNARRVISRPLVQVPCGRRHRPNRYGHVPNSLPYTRRPMGGDPGR